MTFARYDVLAKSTLCSSLQGRNGNGKCISEIKDIQGDILNVILIKLCLKQ